MSNASVIAGDPLRLNYDNQTIGLWNCVNWSYRRTAHMLMRIGQIFGAEFGADEVRDLPLIPGNILPFALPFASPSTL